jgi:hypothetical protein
MTPTAAQISGGPTFRVRLRSGVWSVTKNDVFFGDYLTRAQAVEGARSAASKTDALLGGMGRVVVEGAAPAPLATRITRRLRSVFAAMF